MAPEPVWLFCRREKSVPITGVEPKSQSRRQYLLTTLTELSRLSASLSGPEGAVALVMGRDITGDRRMELE